MTLTSITLKSGTMPRISSAIFAIVLALFAGTLGAETQENTIKLAPRGEYATIDTGRTERVVKDLLQSTSDPRQQAVRAVIAAPQDYAPPAFYALSSALFQAGDKDEAAFWFYAGQLRARFDANRCNDPTAASAVAALNDRFGTPINQYSFQDPDKLEALIERVVEWDRTTPHDYDHRWINLHGMAAMQASMGKDVEDIPLSLPEDQWDAIAEQTRMDYLAGLQQALEQFR